MVVNRVVRIRRVQARIRNQGLSRCESAARRAGLRTKRGDACERALAIDARRNGHEHDGARFDQPANQMDQARNMERAAAFIDALRQLQRG